MNMMYRLLPLQIQGLNLGIFSGFTKRCNILPSLPFLFLGSNSRISDMYIKTAL